MRHPGLLKCTIQNFSEQYKDANNLFLECRSAFSDEIRCLYRALNTALLVKFESTRFLNTVLLVKFESTRFLNTVLLVKFESTRFLNTVLLVKFESTGFLKLYYCITEHCITSEV